MPDIGPTLRRPTAWALLVIANWLHLATLIRFAGDVDILEENEDDL